MGFDCENIKGEEMESGKRPPREMYYRKWGGKGGEKSSHAVSQQLNFSFAHIIHIHAWEQLSTPHNKQ